MYFGLTERIISSPNVSDVLLYSLRFSLNFRSHTYREKRPLNFSNESMATTCP